MPDESYDEAVRRRLIRDESIRYPSSRRWLRRVRPGWFAVVASFFAFIVCIWLTRWAWTANYDNTYTGAELVPTLVWFVKVTLKIFLMGLAPVGVVTSGWWVIGGIVATLPTERRYDEE